MNPISAHFLRFLAIWLVSLSPLFGEGMIQYFNTDYRELKAKIPELAEAGYESLWLPPPTKASGGLSVGYDCWDRFDLGSKDQRGSVSTFYGTEAELLELIAIAHRFGMRVYLDNVMNHNAFDIPGFNAGTPIDIYPGFVPEDFHLRVTEEGYFRKWDNTRNWNDAWQVMNLGLSDLVDIATEPGDWNFNFGPNEGDRIRKISFVRHPGNPEYYCYKPTAPGQKHSNGEGEYVGFGPDNGITAADLLADESFYSERVEDLLHRAARWQIDRTKADGYRLDAVKHTPADFFGATFGADKDTSDYGYSGQIQRQFNLTRGFSDANHRDTVFNTQAPRDDAMLFGEHLGQPPSYQSYIDSGMRLIDNDLRSAFNNRLGNPAAGLEGFDQPGSGGFPTAVSVMHAQSHDSDFAARRELQHAFYFTRAGIPLIYTDGNYQAETLSQSGGAFPRHANTNFLGQFGDPRLPNLATIHQNFARGYQVGRWSDGDFVAYERIDKRENWGMSDADGVTALVLVNDNFADGQARNFSTSFPAVGGTGADAYLYQYASGPGLSGFYTYASNLDSVIVPPGGYFVFSWRSPESTPAWQNAGGSPLTIYQNGEELDTITVSRRDGPDGDPGYNPYGLPDSDPTDYTYEIEIPRVTDGSNLRFVARTDGSAENILFKLDGGIDLNGTRPAGNADPGFRDNPPAVSTDVFLGYEQPSFVRRQGPEKFAATDTSRCQIGSTGAETFVTTPGSGVVTRVDGTGSNPIPPDSAAFFYHDPTADVIDPPAGTPQHFNESGSTVTLWAKSNTGLSGYLAYAYYTLDGSNPEGSGGDPTGTTQVSPMAYSHDADGGSWFSAPIDTTGATELRYKLSIVRTSDGTFPLGSVFPTGPDAVDRKLNMMTVFEVDGFDATSAEFYPHNDYGVTQTGLSEGFHMLRARAFLQRPGQASIYNTFTKTFYYDTKRPEGEIVFPSENDTLGGQNYGVVVRTDSSVEEVWYFIDDGVGPNDDDATGTTNGNGPGKWVRASESQPTAAINSSYPREWRFNYNNIPAGNTPASIQVRLVEASSADPATWTSTVSPADDEAGHYTTLTRQVTANGPDQRIFIAFPAQNGEVVGEGYVMKAYFTKNLGENVSDEQLIDEFLIRIGSNVSGSLDGAEAQNREDYSIIRDETSEYHALAFPLPNLYNNEPDFLHSIEVTHTRNDITLRAERQVRAAVVDTAFLSITNPPAFGSDGRPYEIILPAVENPLPVQRQTTIRVVTDADVDFLNLEFEFGNGITVFDRTEVLGSRKIWHFLWTDLEEGNYRFRVEARCNLGDPIIATERRNATVLFRQVLPENPEDPDDDDDGLLDANELTEVPLPSSNPETWTNGQVHVWRIFGRSSPLTPDTDGDLLPDALEQGWRTVSSAQEGEAFDDTGYGPDNEGAGNLLFDWDDANGNFQHDPGEASEPFTDGNGDNAFQFGTILSRDTDGDGTPNFAPDLDPPFFNTVPDNWNLPNYDFNRGRADQIHGSMTSPSNPDTDRDGIMDGIEDGYNPAWASGQELDRLVHNGWVDGDGSPLSPTENDPNARGNWPNGVRDLGETWLETDPNNPDTDGDGLSDGFGEDTDGNGLINGDSNRNRVYDAGEAWSETNPLDEDTDGDGLLDGWERQNGLDPLDNGTDNLATADVDDGDPDQGAGGDPDGDSFTNLQEQSSGTNPQIDDSVALPAPNSIIIGPEEPVVVGNTVNSREFAGWTTDDLIAFDEFEGEGFNNQGGDVFPAGDGFDGSRDIVAFYARDGGADGKFYFRLDLYDLRPFAEEGNLDIYVAIDTGNPAIGESALPDEIDIRTDMRWELLAACYQSNIGRVFVDRDPANNTSAVNQNLADGGVEIRDQSTPDGFGEAYYNSDLDAVEFSISRQALIDAGWNGATQLRYQVYTTRDGTQNDGTGAGDLGGRNDIRDTINDDYLAEDYWSAQEFISNNGRLINYLIADGNTGLYPDQRKSAKVMMLAHANRALVSGGEIQQAINSGFSTGYHRLVDAHEAFDSPLTLHLTPTAASAIQWAKVDPASPNSWRDGPAFNARLATQMQLGRIDLLGTTFADHLPSYFSTGYNQDNNLLARDFLNEIYGVQPSGNVFWTPERVADPDVFNKVSAMGYSYTFVDQMRHLFKWLGRGTALSDDGYRLNRFHGVNCFVINDQASTYRYQNADNGLPFPLRNLYLRKARSGTQDQVVTLFHNGEEFADFANAAAYDRNLRWMAARPWIRVVTPGQIANNEIDINRDNLGDAWFVLDRGSPSLPKVAADFIDHATQEDYDNWYLGSPNEEGLLNKVFDRVPGSPLPDPFGMQVINDDGIADQAWTAAASTDATTSLGVLARATAHSATWLTAFHNQQNTDTSKYSTGDYIWPDSDFNTLADFSKNAQSQMRFAAIYAEVEDWAQNPPATASATSADIDLDGAPEYLLTNSRVFALFEATGGRLTAAWAREPVTGRVFQVLGNFLSYSGSETEFEGDTNNSGSLINARRTSGFKDWFAAGPDSNGYVNDSYSVSPAAGAGWTFQSSDGLISKTISLADSATTLVADYDLDPAVSKLFVRFGLTPDLEKLLKDGQLNLSDTIDTGASVGVENLTSTERVAASVRYGGPGFSGSSFQSAATDRAPGVFEVDTINMRNQAQTVQVEMESTAQSFTLGLDLVAECGDCDGDQLPGDWEAANGLDDSDDGSTSPDNGPNGDPDGDGMNNFTEYLVGLDPQVVDMHLYPQLNLELTAGGDAKLDFPALPDRRYRIQWSENLQDWFPLGADILPTAPDPALEVTDDGSIDTPGPPADSDDRYYQLLIQLP